MKLSPRISLSTLLLLSTAFSCASPTLPPKADTGSGEDTSATLSDTSKPDDAKTPDAAMTDSIDHTDTLDANDNADVDSESVGMDVQSKKCKGYLLEGCPCDPDAKYTTCCNPDSGGFMCSYSPAYKGYRWSRFSPGCPCIWSKNPPMCGGLVEPVLGDCKEM